MMRQVLANEVLDVAMITAVWSRGDRRLAAEMAGEWIRRSWNPKTRKRRIRTVFDLAHSLGSAK